MMRSPRPRRAFTTGRVISSLRLVACAGALAVAVWLVIADPSDVWLAGGGLLMAIALAWLSSRPGMFNYPLEITDVNAQAIYREGERMMVWLLASAVVVFLGISMQVTGLSGAPLPIAGLVAMPIVLVVGVVRILVADMRASKPAP